MQSVTTSPSAENQSRRCTRSKLVEEERILGLSLRRCETGKGTLEVKEALEYSPVKPDEEA